MKDILLALLVILSTALTIKTSELGLELRTLKANYEITHEVLLHNIKRINKLEAQKTADSLKLTVTKKKKKLPLDSAQVSHLEHVIYRELIKEGVDSSMARIVVAIAKHESNGFNSGLFRNTNNLFGMTYPPRRPTMAIGNKVFLDNGNVRRFCAFESVTAATQDMVMYLRHWKYPLDVRSPEEMVRIMKSKRYFEANEGVYLKAVKRHLSQLTI